MDHSQIMGLIASPSSWEQVIYEVVAFEGLDPWDIDLVKLAEGFLKYVRKLEEMDFKIPAKYVMVASTLLRMKSDHLPLLDYFAQPEEEALALEENGVSLAPEDPGLSLLTIPPRRVPTRRIVVSELIEALRKALGRADRKQVRLEKARGSIKISHQDLSRRISLLYERITSLLSGLKAEEVEFSRIVPRWDRPNVTGAFLPLVYLDHQKRVEARQEDMFQEIYVRKGQGQATPGLPDRSEKSSQARRAAQPPVRPKAAKKAAANKKPRRKR